MSTVASLGLIFMWNFDECQDILSEYLDLKDGYAKAGALIALGLSNSGVWNEADPTKAVLMENLDSKEDCIKLGVSIGLGLGYAASSREDLLENFSELINDPNLPMSVNACAALSMGLVFVSDCNEEAI